MKTPIRFAIVLLLSTIGQPASIFAQGSLAPPGAPAPTMKTLGQIEPRTPISSAPFTITNGGSYYLTTNVTIGSGNGITISANDVTLDLNGFALTGNSSGNGIHFPSGQTNIIVRNGSMSGWNYGFYAPVGAIDSRNIVLDHMAISSCANYGIISYGQARLRDCLCMSNGFGIYLRGGHLLDCDASNNAYDGIHAFNGIVRNCRAADNGYTGILVAPGMVSGCLVQNNRHSGIYIDSPGSEVVGNTCIGNNTSGNSSDAGIYIHEGNSRIEDNHVTDSGYAGISVVDSSGVIKNIIIKNSVSGNGANNYLTPGSQVVGPLITTSGTITNLNPWANFSF